MPRYIPDLKITREHAKHHAYMWGIRTAGLYDYQYLIPKEPFVLPNIKEDSTFLIFAGYTGEFYHKLNAKKFIFTDASNEVVKEAKRRSPPDFKEKTEFVFCDAYFLPFRDNCVDYTISFEPIPVLEIPYFLLEMVRCAKKGVILIFGPAFAVDGYYLSDIGRSYGIKVETKTMKLAEKRRVSVDIRVDLYKITEKVKRNITIDLKVIQKANELARKKGELAKTDLEVIRNELGISKTIFSASLLRIRAMQTIEAYTLKGDY